jgi:hypothetical protein
LSRPIQARSQVKTMSAGVSVVTYANALAIRTKVENVTGFVVGVCTSSAAPLSIRWTLYMVDIELICVRQLWHSDVRQLSSDVRVSCSVARTHSHWACTAAAPQDDPIWPGF